MKWALLANGVKPHDYRTWHVCLMEKIQSQGDNSPPPHQEEWRFGNLHSAATPVDDDDDDCSPNPRATRWSLRTKTSVSQTPNKLKKEN